jgi:hypothetical protein
MAKKPTGLLAKLARSVETGSGLKISKNNFQPVHFFLFLVKPVRLVLPRF